MKFRQAVWLLLLFVAGGIGRSAGADPFPSVAAFAGAHDIPFTRFELGEAETKSQPGDRVTLLLNLAKAGSASQQWLVLLELDEPTAKESAGKSPEDIIHTSTGLELHYATSPAALRVKLIGPFTPESATAPAREAPVQSKEARAVVSREYLNLGLAEYCRDGLKITARTKGLGIEMLKYGGKGSPYSAESIAKGKAAAEKAQLTPDEERLAFSVYFALRTFFDAAIKISALQDVLEQVIVKPSAWSIVTNVGLKSNFVYGWQEARQITDGFTGLNLPTYSLPLRVSLNGTLALTATLAVANPQPPLEACAGILAIEVKHPTDATKRLSIRVLAARRSGAK